MAPFQAVLNFWFEELKPAQWWRKDRDVDHTIVSRFGELHRAAARGELYLWRYQSLGRLAEIIILDQFSRNIYRDSPLAFAQDSMALALAQEAIALHADQDVIGRQKAFFYMPFMHSESPLIHQLSIALFSAPGLEDNLRSAHQHKTIIDRFGRFPHRNKILARNSTTEELSFLEHKNAAS